jgi:hypothetical protein
VISFYLYFKVKLKLKKANVGGEGKRANTEVTLKRRVYIIRKIKIMN